MFYIHATPKAIKLITSLLEKAGFVVRETKFKEYILVRNDPTAVIPDHLRNSVEIKEDDGNFISFLKEAGSLRDILNPPKLGVGIAVLVTEGMYKGFKGIIKAFNDHDDTYTIDVSVWGRIVSARIETSNVREVRIALADS